MAETREEIAVLVMDDGDLKPDVYPVDGDIEDATTLLVTIGTYEPPHDRVWIARRTVEIGPWEPVSGEASQ